MEAVGKRYIKSGREYDYLFPAAMNKDKTVKENATLEDTIAFIHKVVGKTLGQTKGIAQKLVGRTLRETCSNIWHFVYQNVAYRKDDDGFEQIRSPRRTWKDRKTGVDCDCYSTFISSILTNLRIPHKLRITKYKRDQFQHIYPVVPDGGRLITIDCVTDQFDYEVPYSEKKDITMDLQYLDGLQGSSLGDRGNDLVFDGSFSIGELGKAKKGGKKKGFFKKVISKINKINPATVLLRNGFLAAMKLNLFKVASRLKYAYLTPEEATKRGILPDKFQKLVKTREKLENIFTTAGGNINNLKKAILKGKGNKGNVVALSGIGFLGSDASVLYMDTNTPLSQLLGPEIYYDENVRGMDGFEGFGELGIATSAAVAAASGAVAAIAKILSSIGNIFGSNQKGAEDFSEGETAAANKEIMDTPATSTPSVALPAASVQESIPASVPATADYSDNTTAAQDIPENSRAVALVDSATESDTSLPVTTAPSATMNAASTNTSSSATKDGFWQKNKKWLLPTVIGVGGIAAIAIGMKLLKPVSKPVSGILAGTPKKRKSRKKKKGGKKKAVSLL
jgi:hypothetical protein